MNCKICKSNSEKIFSGKILNKYEIDYFKCQNCGFIQTEEPFWLQESYSSVIAMTDIGLVARNLSFQNITTWIIKNYFDYKAKFIDFAGGYGLFVRLMRDRGLDFYRQDFYCENYFAQYFDVTDLNNTDKYELLTAFEVFEHLVHPFEEIEKMFDYSDSIFFSTELQPQIEIKSIQDWRYFAKETGQHVAFYNIKSLEIIAEKLNCHFYSNGNNLHILTKKKLVSNPFQKWQNKNKKSFVVRELYKIIRKLEHSKNQKINQIHLESLLEKDYHMIINKINNNN
ncbi:MULTISPECIES: class I SAM-dependent methyltransferase [unclassified Flavobacterium]|uniref:class I SAM-dependent methyltransferase n=1 Tax=unclassified Flavobacterium TaxID=196869 RepID=UPI0006ABCAF1|nr:MULTISPECIES: class I SAM-dependent methyltransferase [unclassified Flavobacterium]OWU91797.1 hypothetical protein APR43_06830 [Flavobacterium sp. NLM]